MKSSYLIVVGQMIFLALQISALSEENGPLVPIHGVATECGQTLHVTESARIEHHFGDLHDDYEACPWTVRFDRASRIQFTLEWDNYDPLALVTVAAIDITHPLSTELSSQKLGYATGIFEATISGSVAVIVFESDYFPGNGFALNITRVGVTEHVLSPLSVDKVHIGSGRFRHPEGEGELYNGNELSTFVVAPRWFTSYCPDLECTTLVYTESLLDLGCFDRVDIFSYSNMYHNGWKHIRVLCSGEGPSTFPNLGTIVLVTFVSDLYTQGSGFDFQYTTSPVTPSQFE